VPYLEAGVDPPVLDKGNVFSRPLLQNGVVLGAEADENVLWLLWRTEDDVRNARRIVRINHLGAQCADLRSSASASASATPSRPGEGM
jgi:hypothetical protein